MKREAREKTDERGREPIALGEKKMWEGERGWREEVERERKVTDQ